MRSWLMRFLDVVAGRERDFRQVPMARFSWPSFLGVLFAFTAGHVVWEWPVAVIWVAGTQLYFYRRRRLLSLVIVHAASNLSIFLFVVAASGRWTDPAGNPMDLWFFL
jgi:membrane protease YdiL (CAAX protease family)